MPDRVGMEVHQEPSLDIGEGWFFLKQQDEIGSLAKLEPDCAPTRKLSSLVKKVAGELGTVER
jgi:hypothetical protein